MTITNENYESKKVTRIRNNKVRNGFYSRKVKTVKGYSKR